MSAFGPARFAYMRQLVSGGGRAVTPATQQQPQASQPQPVQPTSLELQRLRREREVMARSAMLRRREAARSGDLGAIEDAQLGALSARNELMDVGLAQESQRPKLKQSQSNEARIQLESQIRPAIHEQLRRIDQELAANPSPERAAMLEADKAQYIDKFKQTGRFLRPMALDETPEVQMPENIPADVEYRRGAAQLRRRAALEMNADAGAALDVNALGRRGALADATMGTEGVEGSLARQRRLMPIEDQTAETLANTDLAAAGVAQGEASDAQVIQNATRQNRLRLGYLQADLERQVAEGTITDAVATAKLNAGAARLKAELESKMGQTASTIASLTGPAMVSEADRKASAMATNAAMEAEAATEAQSVARDTAPKRRAAARIRADIDPQRAEVERLQVQAEAEAAREQIGLQRNPSAGIIRQESQLPAEDRTGPKAAQALRDAATVFDAEDAGSATYSQVAEGDLPQRVNVAMSYIERLAEDAASGVPAVVAAAKQQALELLREMPIAGSSGGFKVKSRYSWIPAKAAFQAAAKGLERIGIEGAPSAPRVRATKMAADLNRIQQLLQQIAGTN